MSILPAIRPATANPPGWRRCSWIMAVLILTLPLSTQARELQGLRVWAGPESTRAVLDLDSPVEYRLFTLDSPHRLVLDLSGTMKARGATLNGEARGLFKGVRTGTRPSGDLRVVLDLTGPVRTQSFLLKPHGRYGHRLVVDLYGKSQDPKPVIKSIETVAPEQDRDVIIAVDAGHGGEDPGAIGPTGVREKHVTLEIARELARMIDAERGMRAVMIRDGDYYVPHRERFEKARHERADLFISIHADAFYDRRVQGASVFVLSRKGASSEAARWLAREENKSDLVGGVKLDDKDDVLASVLLDLSQSATMAASSSVAEQVLGSVKRVARTHKNYVESANFAVLKSPDVPSLLFETAFISNPAEERRLNNPAERRKLARAVADGIQRYFFENPPPGTWLASNRATGSHTVTRGDTLSGIADRYKVSMSKLKAVNDLNGDRLLVGEVLKIPAS